MARKTRGDEAASVRVSIRLTPTERTDLQAVAKDNGTTLAGVVRDAVNEYVADYREKPVFAQEGTKHVIDRSNIR